MDTPQVPAGEAAAKISWSDKFIGVLSSPGELFTAIGRMPVVNSNWVVPTIILALVGSILAYVVMSNPSIADQVRRMATEQMEQRFQKAIAEGKMTQQQADQARAQAQAFGEKGFLISAVVAPLLMPFIGIFAWSLVFWLLGKAVMKATVPYLKVAETYGLTYFIAIIGSVVTTIMIIGMDKYSASPSPMLLLGEFNASNSFHKFAASLNIFSLWQIGVVGIGLAKIFQKETAKVVVLVFALWLLWTAAITFGLGAL